MVYAQWAIASEEAIAASGLTKEDIDLLIPHQANLRIVEGLREKPKNSPMLKTLKYVHKYGKHFSRFYPYSFC